MIHCRGAAISRSTRAHGWPLVLRCLLLVTAWQGPVPWCHSHEALSDPAVMAPSSLMRHLQLHHQRTGQAATGYLGWHIHVSFPISSGEDPAEPAKQDWHPHRLAHSQSDCSVLFDQVRSVGPLARDAALHWGPSPMATEQRAVMPGHFFDAFAPTLPMPLRFGILRC